MPPDLTDDDKAVLVELLRDTIAADRFPLSPKIKRLKAIPAKLDSPTPRPEPLPPPKPPGERRHPAGEEASAVAPADDRLILQKKKSRQGSSRGLHASSVSSSNSIYSAASHARASATQAPRSHARAVGRRNAPATNSAPY
jgi:hypothetical protein